MHASTQTFVNASQ